MQSADRDHFFETEYVYNFDIKYHLHTDHTCSAVQAQRQRKAAKASNQNGEPIAMKSKILAVVPDPASPLTSVFIAESAGAVRRINLEVCQKFCKDLCNSNMM